MITICYHGNCTDGWTSAWAAKKFYGAEVVLAPLEHGKPHPPITPGGLVLYLDYFPGCIKLMEVAKEAYNVIVLDHHATALEEYNRWLKLGNECPGNVEVNFVSNMSGALMTWKRFMPESRIPPLVSYVSDNDIWEHRMPSSRMVSAYIQSFEHTEDNWDYLAELTAEQLMVKSVDVWRVKQQNAALSAKNAYEKMIHCNKVLQLAAVVNVGFPLSQDTLVKLLETYDLAISYSRTSDGKWRISARSTDKSKISAKDFCESLDGGGHKNASGATVASTPLHLM
jgi:oligoribonuclease NrnB/cAMP/cGMP phosphodiesterase (DHH superfamily)